jgi:hypothetical protein
MSIQFPAQPWQEGDTFVNDATGVEYTFDGVKWLASGGDAASEAAPPVYVGDTPPDDPSEGDLWMVSRDDEDATDRLFVYAADQWEPTTSLQRERRTRIAEDLLLATRLSAADSHYMMRLDPHFLPDPLLANKSVVVHDNDGPLPDEITDDKIHFKADLSRGNYQMRGAELAFRGDAVSPDVEYAIMYHHRNDFMTYREEWRVGEVTYVQGTVHVFAVHAYGDSYGSFDDWECDLWLLTEEEASRNPNADAVAQLALGLRAISTPRCNGSWQFKGKLSDGPPRNDGEFSLIYDVDREDNFLTMITTDLSGTRLDLMDLVKPGDYAQVYDLDNPDSYTIHTIDDVLLGSINPEMVEMPCTLVANGNEFVKGDKCAVRFFAVKDNPLIAENAERIAELEARMDDFEELMAPWSGLDIGTYATKAENYEPTGSSQAEGTAGMWWISVHMNSTPNNHVRIGMQANPDLCKQIAAMPVPFEMDVIQPEAQQTWHVYEVYERGTGVLHVLNDVAWGDELTHSHIAVDTQYIVRKV